MNPQLEYEEAIRQNPADPLPRLRLGQILLTQNQLLLAQDCFETVLKIKPDHLEAQKSLAKLFYVQKKYAESIALYQKVLEVDFKDPQTHFDLGLAYFESGHPELFSRECVKALTVDPYFAKAHFVQGILYSKAGKNDKAVRELKMGLKINHADPKAHYYLAKIYRDQSLEEDCIFEAMETLKYDPQHVGAHFFLGEILYKHGDYALALKKFNECLEIKADLPSLKTLHDVCFQKAEAIYLQALEKNSEDIKTLDTLAQFYFENGKHELAISFVKKIMQIRPQDERFVINLAAIYQLSQNWFEAYENLKTFLKKYPHQPEVQKKLKEAFDGCEKQLQSTILKNPAARESRLKLIELYLGEDQLLEALEEYQNYFEKFPEDFRQKPRYQKLIDDLKKQTDDLKTRSDLQAILNFRLGHLALAQSNYDRALEIFGSLLKQYPSDAGMVYGLLRASYLQKDFHKAREFARQLKKMNPQYRYVNQIETEILKNEFNRLQNTLAKNKSDLSVLKELVQLCVDTQSWAEIKKYWATIETSAAYAREISQIICNQLQPMYQKQGLTDDECELLGLAYQTLGKTIQSLYIFQRLLKQNPQSKSFQKHSETLAKQCLTLLSDQSPDDLYEKARLLCFLKQFDASLNALQLLKKMDAKQILKVRFDSDFQAMHQYAGFKNLVEQAVNSKVDTQQ